LGDTVIVSTERGEEIGEVATALQEIADEDVERKLKPVLRVATDHDLQIAEELEEKESRAMRRFRELVAEHELDMKPVAVEALFDGRKIVFYFSAEERVDFRSLVKDLAREFKARIDMRQIGVRDEARMLGGIGHCGQQLCCRRFMQDFEPVSIRMAKAQDLPLNPLKISGLCGRLMCCLRYEYEAYKDFKSRAPKMGAKIETSRGNVRVVSLDAPRETVTLQLDDSRVTLPLQEMECEGCPGGKPCRVSDEALQTAAGAASMSFLVDSSSRTDTKEGSKKRRRRSPSSGKKGDGRPKDGGGSGGKGQDASGESRSGKGSQGQKKGRSKKKRRRGSRGRKKGGSQGGGQKGQSGGTSGSGSGTSGSKGRSSGSTSGGKSGKGQSGGGSSGGGKSGGQSRGESQSSGSPGRRRRRRRDTGSGS
jgi:cell fate regulator YaaT (PSP1 superfamily)